MLVTVLRLSSALKVASEAVVRIKFQVDQRYHLGMACTCARLVNSPYKSSAELVAEKQFSRCVCFLGVTGNYLPNLIPNVE